MMKFIRFFTILASVTLCFPAFAVAGTIVPEDGKVYKILNASKSNAAICEDYAAHTLYCGGKGDETRYDQMWKVAAKGSGFSIQNVYTGLYVQTQPSATYQLFKTGTTEVTYYFRQNPSVGDYCNISSNSGASNWVMHCQSDNAVVGWYPTNKTVTASEWYLEEVSISEEEIALAQLTYRENAEVVANEENLRSAILPYFTDNACTELNAAYAAMSDDELRTAMSGLPTTLKEMAVKIKNDSWGKREKEFRIREYEAYSDANTWGTKLFTKKYSYLDNPTGVYGKAATLLYVFVDADTPADATLQIMGVTGTDVSGNKIALKKGLNVVSVSKDNAMQFILYTANTTGNKVIADFPDIKIHIEGGIVNGFFDKKVHTDADWVDITQNLATHEAIQVKGEKMIFHMSLEYITAANCCRNKISDAIGWWDNMGTWQQELMGFEEVCPSRFNNHLCAISLTSGYQSATDYRTQYSQDYIRNLLPLANVLSNADNAWGPAHENGHVHQLAINMVGCSEVSNNMFSNYIIYKLGKYMSRGAALNNIASEYNAGKSWFKRDGWTKMRMYWQLVIYYHILGKNPDFYPTLFKSLRETPLARKTNNTGMEDQLLFAEKCCDAAGEDLSDFFEAWGFFVPVNNEKVDDYGTYYLTVTQKEIDEAKAYMKKYEKAAPIEFIEDRVKYEPRADGGTGNKLTNDVAVGSAGAVGHYTDFAYDTIVASGYSYSRTGTFVKIAAGTGAVGFKVYDAEGNMISFSNQLSFNIPASAVGKELHFYAIQVNGKKVEIALAAEGTEEQQLEALNNALTVARTYTALSNAGGTKAGYYYADAVADLTVVYDGAVAAKSDKDQSVHTYGEWSLLINAEIDKLMQKSDVKIVIKEKNYYSIVNASYTNYSLGVNNGLLVCNTNTSMKLSDPRKKWEFIAAGSGNKYYVKSKSGNYISAVVQSSKGEAKATAQADALIFNVVDNGNGTFYLKATDEDAQCLHCDGSKNLVGWNNSSTASHWYLTVTENNAEKYELAALDSLIRVAAIILGEVCDTLASTAEVPVISSNVYPDDSVTFYGSVKNLYVAYEEAVEIYGNANNYSEILVLMKTTIAAVQGKYKVMPDMPIGSTENTVTWYYIKNIDKGTYCSIDSISPRYKDQVIMTGLQGNEEDKSLWYCLIPTGAENEYYIYNRKMEACVFSISNGTLKVSAPTVGIPYMIKLDTEKFGFLISNGEYRWTAATYARIGKIDSYWALEKILTEENDCLTGIRKIEMSGNAASVYYDLNGRKVSAPTRKGIYIHNGKKIFVK